MPKPSSELSSLQVGRGLAALAVVLYHLNGSIFGKAKYWPEQFSSVFVSGYSGVEYFFVLSGFLMAYIHWSQLGQRNSPWPFLYKRFVRIYPAYWAALCGVLILILAATRTLPVGVPRLLQEFALLPAAGDAVLAVSWTLQHEMVFYLFFAAFLWNARIGGVALAVWIAASLVGPFLALPFPWSFMAADFHLLFGFGIAAAWALQRGMATRPLILTLVGGVLFAAAWTVSPFRDLGAPYAQAVRWTFGLGAALLILGLAQLERAGRFHSPRALKALGDASYAIYLAHFPALSIGAKVIFALGFQHIIPRPVAFGLILAFAVATGFAFHFVVELPLIKLFRATRRPSGGIEVQTSK